MKKLARGRYLTDDGRFILENLSASTNEYDIEDEPEWFIFPAERINDDYGAPDALNPDGFATRREAAEYTAYLG